MRSIQGASHEGRAVNSVRFLMIAITWATAEAWQMRLAEREPAEVTALTSFTPWTGSNRSCNVEKSIVDDKKLFFIGLHKTGTTTYAELTSKLGLASHHSCGWWRDALQGGLRLIAKYDAFADGGWRDFLQDPEDFEFGSPYSFDPRYLHTCMPRAWFVMSVRPLGSWLASNLHHWLSHGCNPGMVQNVPDSFTCVETCTEDVVNFIEQWAVYREYYHRRVLDYARENPTFAKRLLLTDLETDGFDQVLRNIREFLGGSDFDTAQMHVNATGEPVASIHYNHHPASDVMKQCVTKTLDRLKMDGTQSVFGLGSLDIVPRLSWQSTGSASLVRNSMDMFHGILNSDGTLE
mmetsp:Transcript_8022/g.16909  ORF Transcript_8022/g.16909 Transcript_8022/m.16909 type:complete len:349 (+) Transcript_8022:105-1151(+)